MFSCEQLDSVQSLSKSEMHVSFVIKGSLGEQLHSKAMDENSINDINIYIFREGSSLKYHVYSVSPIINRTVIGGKYKILTIANYGSDLGDKTLDELEAMTISNTRNDEIISSGNILMSAVNDITINSTGQRIPIEVSRNVAKINLLLNVNIGVDIKLKSIQFFNLPKEGSLFNINTLSSQLISDYTYGDKIDISIPNSYSGQLYIFENRQGVRTSITDQKNKNPLNAPLCATYAHIIGYSGTSKVEYFVYLGENNTTDFNVRRNTLHSITATIYGTNTIDTRVELKSGKIIDNNKYFTIAQSFRGTIETSSSNLNKLLYAKINVIDGDINNVQLSVRNQIVPLSADFELYRGGSSEYSLIYSPAPLAKYRYFTYKVVVHDESDVIVEQVQTLECRNLMPIEIITTGFPAQAIVGTKVNFKLKITAGDAESFDATYLMTQGGSGGVLYVDPVWVDSPYGDELLSGFKVSSGNTFTLTAGEHNMYYKNRMIAGKNMFTITATNGLVSKTHTMSIYLQDR